MFFIYLSTSECCIQISHQELAKYVASLVCITDNNHCNLEPCNVWNLLTYSKVIFTSCFCDLQFMFVKSREEHGLFLRAYFIEAESSISSNLVKNLQNQFLLDTDALSVLDELGKTTLQ